MDLSFSFSSEAFNSFLDVIIIGISSGFTLGFVAWAIGYAIYAVSKFFKMA